MGSGTTILPPVMADGLHSLSPTPPDKGGFANSTRANQEELVAVVSDRLNPERVEPGNRTGKRAWAAQRLGSRFVVLGGGPRPDGAQSNNPQLGEQKKAGGLQVQDGSLVVCDDAVCSGKALAMHALSLSVLDSLALSLSTPASSLSVSLTSLLRAHG